MVSRSGDGFLCGWIDELAFRREGQASTHKPGSEHPWVTFESRGPDKVTRMSFDEKSVSSPEPWDPPTFKHGELKQIQETGPKKGH